MKNQFVTYEIALALKELGFDEISRFSHETSLYSNRGHHVFYANYGFYASGLGDGYIYAPLWQQVIDWLREKHGMIILPFMFDELREDYFSYRIVRRQGNINVHYPYKSYYEAREQAILKAIELCQK